MEYRVKNIVMALVALSITNLALANNYIEASFGIAWMNSANSGLDSNEYAAYRIVYGHPMTEWLFLETGYLAGDNYDNESLDNFETDMFFMKLKGLIALNNNNAIFAKLGGHAYRYDLQNDDDTVSTEDGLGYSFAAGWEHVLENRRLLVGLEYENLYACGWKQIIFTLM